MRLALPWVNCQEKLVDGAVSQDVQVKPELVDFQTNHRATSTGVCRLMGRCYFDDGCERRWRDEAGLQAEAQFL